VNVTSCAAVPTVGVVPGVVNANEPATDAVPPVRVEEARVCPSVIGDAVGHAVTFGVALLIVNASALDDAPL